MKGVLSDYGPGTVLKDEKGSYLVLGLFFMVLFLLIAVMGVDLSRYFLERQKAQAVADDAALAGAQALNQVRPLEDLKRSEVLNAILERISSHGGYDLEPYTYTAEMDQGDIQFSKFSPDATHPDTYFRVGVNVLQTFEPYFLPRAVFGDQFHTIQTRAVAEASPHFSKNFYQTSEVPEPPIPPLQYGIYSEHNIKPETMDCFQVEGGLHANDGPVTLEEMTGDGCGSGNSVEIDGRIEAGDLGTAGAGDATFQNVDGYVSDDVVYASNYSSSNGPTIQGNTVNADPPVVDVPTVPTPEDAPDSYSEPICTYSTDKTITDFSSDLGECADGGTVHVKGDLKISGSNMDGDYSLVADGQVKFESTPDLSSNRTFVYSVNDFVKFENVVDAEINAQIYAPNGEVKWETSENVTINGGLVSGTKARLETSGRLTINYRNYSDLMPDPLVMEGVRPEDIPDYYVIRLIH